MRGGKAAGAPGFACAGGKWRPEARSGQHGDQTRSPAPPRSLSFWPDDIQASEALRADRRTLSLSNQTGLPRMPRQPHARLYRRAQSQRNFPFSRHSSHSDRMSESATMPDPRPICPHSSPSLTEIVRIATLNDASPLESIHPMEPVTAPRGRSEEHTYELQSLMRNSYAVFCLKKKKK